MTTYFGFAVADSMFPANCSVQRIELPIEEVKTMLHNVVSCLNPSHIATIQAMKNKYGLEVEIPEKPPVVKLQQWDRVIVMSVRGLPRLTDRKEYTQEEIDSAEFSFGLWTVLDCK